MPEIECEVARRRRRHGRRRRRPRGGPARPQVCLVEETDWLGGQLTSQGVSALDEHDLIESFGGTASYYEPARAIRAHYEELGSMRGDGGGNPGSCWVTQPRLRALRRGRGDRRACSRRIVESGRCGSCGA